MWRSTWRWLPWSTIPGSRSPGWRPGTPTSYAVASVLAFRAISGRIGGRPAKGYFPALTKMLAASGVTGAGAWLAARGAAAVAGGTSVTGLLAQVFAATAAGVLLYAGLSKALSLEEMRWISTIVKRRR